MLQIGRYSYRGTGAVMVAGPLGVALVPPEWAKGAREALIGRAEIVAWLTQVSQAGADAAVLDLAGPQAHLSLLGRAWVRALAPGLADPAVIVPCALALFSGALLTVLEVRATVLEALTLTVPALVAGVAGGVLAAVGFFGPSHVGLQQELQSAAACVIVGFVAGVLMAASNRVLWTHRWVPGGRAAVASAIVPILALGAPVYAIARLMGSFIAG